MPNNTSKLDTMTLIKAGLALTALLGFIVIVIYSIVVSFPLPVAGELPREIPTGLVALGNALNGLVGGIVAAGFGLALNDNRLQPQRLGRRRQLGQHMGILGLLIAGKMPLRALRAQALRVTDVQKTLGYVYSTTYFVLGIVCIALYASASGQVTALTTTLGQTAMGLIPAIVTTFLSGWNQ